MPDGSHFPLKIRSLVGLIPLFAVETLEPDLLDLLPRFRRRWEILQKFDGAREHGRYAEDFQAYYRGAHAMMESPEIRKVLMLSDEEKKRYGGTPLGDACALARNLV